VKLCFRLQNVFVMQAHAWVPPSPCQVWCSLDFALFQGTQKRRTFYRRDTQSSSGGIRSLWAILRFFASCAAGGPKMLTFLFVLLVRSITLLNDTVCANDFAQKSLEYRNDLILISLDKRRSVVLHLHSALSVCCQVAPPGNVKVDKKPSCR